MPYPTEPPRESPSAYIVQDRDNQEEMTRLEVQDKMLTIGMGGVLPEQDDPASLRKILDVGCGTGDWIIEIARTYPTIERLVGADISSKMLTHARARAKAQGLDERLQFQTMDALRALEFPAASFDLVNHRFGASWLRSWEWTKILLEYQRVTRPGGIIRVTECNIVESNSPALTNLFDIFRETFYHSGRFFAATNDGITSELVRLMTQHAIQNVQTRLHNLIYPAGTQVGQYFYQDIEHLFHTLLPFFHKWTRVPSDYQQIYRQALKEMQQPDFVATWTLITVWGNKPVYGESLLMRGLK